MAVACASPPAGMLCSKTRRSSRQTKGRAGGKAVRLPTLVTLFSRAPAPSHLTLLKVSWERCFTSSNEAIAATIRFRRQYEYNVDTAITIIYICEHILTKVLASTPDILYRTCILALSKETTQVLWWNGTIMGPLTGTVPFYPLRAPNKLPFARA